VIIASAPTRLDFGGGWTDVPPFPEERGGFVCNLAIERRATVVWRRPTVANPLSPATEDGARDPLIAAAVRRASRHPSWPDLAAASPDISLSSDFPVGAGLGGSSAAGVALAAACAAACGESLSPSALAERSRATEVDELQVAGGFQDHYAAAYGGALGLTLSASRHAEVLPLTQATRRCLEARLTLVYTGESRISAETITAVLDSYAARDTRVVTALDRMASLARHMAEALSSGDISTLGELMDEHWVHQQSLHPRITTARIAAIESAVRAAGAAGFKALGASGGGCVLVCSPMDRTDAVRAAAGTLGEVLTWRVATEGVRVQVVSDGTDG
jgi:D-glycero-alpha-D-manno-heptose-7-phosphate kinase